MKKLMFAALMMFAHSALAADAYTFKNLGFSADGRYYAFVQSVVQDGSGFPSAGGQIVEVASNRAVVLKNVVVQDDTAPEKKAVDQVIAAMNLSRFGIDGRHLGQTLWVRLNTDHSQAAKQAEFSLDYGVNGGASSVWPRYSLELTEVPAQLPNDACFGMESQAVQMSAKLTDIENGAQRELQSASDTPASRKCASNYQIRQVIKFGRSIVGVLRYETLGFEGPDYNHMVITGANAVPN